MEAEIAWAVDRAPALSLDDLLVRRLRSAPMLRDRGEAVAPRVAEIAGGILGWGADRQAREVAAYLTRSPRVRGPGAD